MSNQAEYDGRILKGIVSAATSWLKEAAPKIDELNVFPVPDGDTGTNMALTMLSAENEALKAGEKACDVLQAIARGALLGARGNSGVILAQICQGFALALQGKETITPKDIPLAFRQAAASAYKGVSKPVEGTMLTVIRELSEALNEPENDFPDLASLLEFAKDRAKKIVAKTPSLLPALARAGVVDAGGQGLYTIIEGALLYLKKELRIKSPEIIKPVPSSYKREEMSVGEFGYCTEFILSGVGIKAEVVSRGLKRLGDSLIIAGDGPMMKVHIHTQDPERVLSQALKWGGVHNALIRNIDRQAKDFKEGRANIALVAVVSGRGFIEIFKSLGASVIIPGGEKMNPSVGELLLGVNSAPAESVLLLPNNKNIFPAAERLYMLSEKKVALIHSKSLPEGVAAALAFNPEASLSDNIRSMEEALSSLKTLSITRAVRGTWCGELKIKKGHFIGLLDDELVFSHKELRQLILGLFERIDTSGVEMITIYYGEGVSRKRADEIAQILRDRGFAEVEVVFGGQPLYQYLISLE